MDIDPIGPAHEGARPVREAFPAVLVHLAIVVAVAVAVVVAGRRSVATLDRIALVASVLATATMGVVAALLVVRRYPVPRALTLGVAALLVSYLCSLLARLPAFAGAAGPLTAGYWASTAIALPVLLVVAWRRVRGGPGAG